VKPTDGEERSTLIWAYRNELQFTTLDPRVTIGMTTANHANS